jgi:hypothetical protein
MNPCIKIGQRAKLLGLVLAASATALYGQEPTASQSAQDSGTKTPTETQPRLKRFSFGARFRWWSAQPFDGKGIEVGNTQTDISHAYDNTSASGRYAVGPAVDLNLTGHLSIRAEAFFEHLDYTKVTKVYTGTPTDGTLNTTYTEHTRTGYWDFPILVRYQGSPRHPTTSTSASSSASSSKIHFSLGGITSHGFVEAGGVIRQLTTVRTGNDRLNSDNSTAYNETPTMPNHRTVEGAIVGMGLRFTDDLNLKVMPEVRYTFWSHPIFESESTLSRTRQLEIGLSFVF